MAYNKNIDYRKLIDDAVASGDLGSAAKYEQARNEKISGEGISAAPTYDYTEKPTDYAAKAGSLYRSGDLSGAYDALFGAADSREAKIARTGSDYGQTSQSIWENLISQSKDRSGSIDALKNQLYTISAQSGNAEPYQNGWGDDTYRSLLEKAIGMNYPEWANGAAYKAISDQYTRNGEKAMTDTLGQISARTGGMASSYAGVAAQQTYDDYMKQLEEVARSAYEKERGNLVENAGLAGDHADTQYSRYMDALNLRRQGLQDQMSAANDLLGYAYQDDSTEYNRRQSADETSYARGQTAMKDAQDRIYSYLTQQGGSIGALDPQLISTSGYTTAELRAMEDKYRQTAAAAASAKSSSGSSGSRSSGSGASTSSSGSGDVDGVFRQMQASGDPYTWLVMNGYTSTEAKTIVENGYASWLKKQSAQSTPSVSQSGNIGLGGLTANRFNSVSNAIQKAVSSGDKSEAQSLFDEVIDDLSDQQYEWLLEIVKNGR